MNWSAMLLEHSELAVLYAVCDLRAMPARRAGELDLALIKAVRYVSSSREMTYCFNFTNYCRRE